MKEIAGILALCGIMVSSATFSQNLCDSVLYGGKWYHGIQIGNQCWMRENLDIGTMVTSTSDVAPHSNASDNGVIEKYCYDNNPAYCDQYGGLYDWSEMMQYSSIEGVQGICPSGWHVPTDAEWTILQSNYPQATAGTELKAGGSSGFNALSGGFRYSTGAFTNMGTSYAYWTSTMNAGSQYKAYFRYMSANYDSVSRVNDLIAYGFSVRCLRDQTTGMDYNEGGHSLSVYPVPSDGVFNIMLENPGDDFNSIFIEITDLMGRTVLSEKREGVNGTFQEQADLSGAPGGIYLLKIMINEKEYLSKKIVIR